MLPEQVRVTVLAPLDGGLPDFLITAGDGTQPTFIYLRLNAFDTALLCEHLTMLLASSDATRKILKEITCLIAD